ncbi:MAG: response regulator transcription factor [Anaerolineae bacterium]|jgi:NarL family two-component system response regulator LiaR
MPDDPILVMIVDDHAMVRRGLAAFLQGKPDLVLVAEADTGEEALRMCERVQPDVILMDLVMPGMSGAEATQAIRSQWPDIQVVALTSFQEKGLVQEALQAGAIGYLLKNVSLEELARAIRAACLGRPTLAPEATRALVEAASQRPPPGHDLTSREREVLVLLTEGLTNRDIAERLTISPSTARAHVSHILSKLGASNRAEAVGLALRNGLVT